MLAAFSAATLQGPHSPRWLAAHSFQGSFTCMLKKSALMGHYSMQISHLPSCLKIFIWPIRMILENVTCRQSGCSQSERNEKHIWVFVIFWPWSFFLNDWNAITEKSTIEVFAMNHISGRPVTRFKFVLLQYFKLPLGKIGIPPSCQSKYPVLVIHPCSFASTVQDKTTCFNTTSTTAAARHPALHTEARAHAGGKWEGP